MVSRAKECALGNTDIIANSDPIQVEQPAFLAQPSVISYSQFPRKCDLDLRFDTDAHSDLGPEQAQDRTFKRR